METLNIVLDIETLGNFPGAVVIEIGAAAFVSKHGSTCLWPEEQMWTFSRAVNRKASQKLGFRTADDNWIWWKRNFRRTLQAILSDGESKPQTCHPRHVLNDFNAWIKQLPRCNRTIFWGNGPEYDMSILQPYFDVLSVPLPWTYTQLASLRSLQALCPDFAAPDIVNEMPHRAVSDAIREAKLIRRFMQTRLVCNQTQPAAQTESKASFHPDLPEQPEQAGSMHGDTL